MKSKTPHLKAKLESLALAAFSVIAMSYLFGGHSDAYIKDRVVKLAGNEHFCTGEQVRAPSGTDYILTAGHCRMLAVDGSIEAITQDGKHIQRRVLAEDPKSDLLLLEGLPKLRGLDVAKSDYPAEEVRTFTHARAMDTHKTAGELVQDDWININADDSDCKRGMPKYSMEMVTMDMGIFAIQAPMCVLHVQETATTAVLQPGSSGGPIVDNSGDIIGVCSAGGTGFSWLVRLSDIHAFLASY